MKETISNHGDGINVSVRRTKDSPRGRGIAVVSFTLDNCIYAGWKSCLIFLINATNSNYYAF